NLFHYTALSSALGQVLTPYVAGTVVRGWAMKARHMGRFGQQAVIAGFEQVFDAVLVLAGGVGAIVLLAFRPPGMLEVLALAIWLALLPPIVLRLAQWLRPASFLADLFRRWRWTLGIGTRLGEASRAG